MPMRHSKCSSPGHGESDIETKTIAQEHPMNPTSHTDTGAFKNTPRGKFLAMAASYCLGVFNDNYFKQAAMLLAVAAGLSHLQGWATMLFALPFILFSAYGGWCADRFPKRRVVIASKGLELIAMLAGAAGLLTGSWICILGMVFTMGLQSTFFSPALNGAIPELYPSDAVPRANATLKLVTTMAILAGVALAGVCLDQGGLPGGTVPLGKIVVAGVAVLVALTGFLASFGVGSRPAAAKDKPFPWLGPWNSLKDLAAISRDRQLFLAVVSDAYFYFIASFTLLTINTLGLEQLGFTQTRTSLLSMSLMLGVCGGSYLAARKMSMSSWSAFLVRAAAGMAGGLLLSGMTVAVPVAARFGWLALSLAATGVAGGLFLIPVTSLLQVRPAEAEKGRILAAAGFSSFIAILTSGVLFGLLAPHVSPALMMGGLGILAFAAAGWLHLLSSRENGVADLLGWVLKRLLAIRYTIEISGLEKIRKQQGRGILFLPNHPALIDPVIVMAATYGRFTPRPLAAADRVSSPALKPIMKIIRPIRLPDVGKAGGAAKERVYAAINEVVACLRREENVLFYPAGRLNRRPGEDLGGNSGVEYILKHVPDVQVVLVRTTGLWGSSYGWASGEAPSFGRHLAKFLAALFCNGLVFGPRRKVTLEFVQDHRAAELESRRQINPYLESFYNAQPVHNTHVPYFWWQGRRPQILPEVGGPAVAADIEDIPASIRDLVSARIAETAGQPVEGGQRLANDLGLDSLTLMELVGWLESEFGVAIDYSAPPLTVNDCILAAGGRSMNRGDQSADSPSREWFGAKGRDLAFEPADTITAGFLKQARKSPGRIIVADRVSGARTYRDMLTAIFLLSPLISRIQGKRVGIMLPASVSAAMTYLAVLFSGKTPVMFNWTVGIANMAHGIRETSVDCIITARQLCTKVEQQQDIRFADLAVDWLYLDEIKGRLGRTAKLAAFLKMLFCSSRLAARPVSRTAAILFTSGSEARPKAVPLSHANILANLGDVTGMLRLRDDTRLLGMLPPFHSLGLVGNIILPLCLGLRTVYHPNPTEPAALAGIIDRYQVSMLISTPTFLNGILQAGTRPQIENLRLIFSGAEKCPKHVMERLKAVNPRAELCEGYGITECSPLVSINIPGTARPGTIGRVLPSIEYAVVDSRCKARVPSGEQGLLLVRGPSIFTGYLNSDSEHGFCEFEGRRWYQTGDYVREEKDKHLIFCGRKKRFVKIGGEMISLPAIENVLMQSLEGDTDAGPALAVEAAPDDNHPEIVLFTTRHLEREEINRRLKAAGLSALHNIRRIVPVEDIPVLGTGKTDYKRLQQLLAA